MQDVDADTAPVTRAWTKADFNSMKTLLDLIDWEEEFEGTTVDEMYSIFMQYFRFLEEEFVPRTKPYNSMFLGP